MSILSLNTPLNRWKYYLIGLVKNLSILLNISTVLARIAPFAFIACVFSVVVVLSGCATAQKSSSENIPPADGKVPVTVLPFQFEGRLAIRAKDDAMSGKIRWTHKKATDQIMLYDPFGRQVAVIERYQRHYRIGNGVLFFESNNVAELTKEYIGYSLPVENIPSWAIGLPAAGLLNQNAPLPYTVRQKPWTVVYTSYGVFDGYRLPVRIQFSAPDISVRLIIDRWHIAP